MHAGNAHASSPVWFFIGQFFCRNAGWPASRTPPYSSFDFSNWIVAVALREVAAARCQPFPARRETVRVRHHGAGVRILPGTITSI